MIAEMFLRIRQLVEGICCDDRYLREVFTIGKWIGHCCLLQSG